MILWRLSGLQHARAFDGGYGLLFDGRWNTAGHAVTYTATSPALCVLEKLVHIEDPALMPELVMVRYEVPDDLSFKAVTLGDLPADWTRQESLTQGIADAWHATLETPLLRVPSAIVPLDGSPDLNVVINNRHPDAARIAIAAAEPFTLDVRLF
jgi:RES domain-containing protein